MALLCIVCKAACGFGGVATDEGPLCESCAFSVANPGITVVPGDEHVPAGDVTWRDTTTSKLAGDRAASPSMDPRSFWPARGAQGLVIEVEEWVYSFDQVLLLTPTDFMATIAIPPCERRYSRFVVILEWSLFADGPTMRDIGPSFGALTDRQAALGEATTFARAEARRLKCHGPFGYKPARSFEV